jgi:meso-butanediol dehydrogenase / (S,S)-butanediol dehydrogenase / diacetyl reductase
LPELDGCAAVVTGAGRGLGRGIALALAGWGARVAALDINADGAAETAQLIQRAGGTAWPARVDVTDETDVRAGLARAAGQFNGLDLVVNGAGVLSVAHVVDLEASEWRRVLEVNATGAFLVSQAAARIMIRASRPASIISIASIAGKIGEPGLAHYAASKFALVGFTQALARELAPHQITVNAVCPGVVLTQMIDQVASQWRMSIDDLLNMQAIHRPQTPDDIALAIAFLHASRSVTGQAINVDGGTIFT